MKARLFFLLKYFIFWIVFAIVAKILFLLYQSPETATLTANDIFMIFWKGLRVDLSFGGYLLMLSSVIMAFGIMLSSKVLKRTFNVLTGLLLVICSVIIVADLELFKNWGYHMDASPLIYLKTPTEAFASTPAALIIKLLLLSIVLMVLFYISYHFLIIRKFQADRVSFGKSAIFLLVGALFFIFVRGGFNVAPMNVSFVFFHPKNMYANQAAINPVWNFFYEVAHINKLKGDFKDMSIEEARAIVDSVYDKKCDFPVVVSTPRPNIVVLLLESFSANALDNMPNLRRVAKEGIFFSNIYGTGNRSDRGLLGTISGFPSHPISSMLKHPSKTYRQPRFPKDFEKMGYTTRFYYAGDINFGGFRSYITMSFQDYVTENDFSGEAIKNRFKWGVHDEYMLERFFSDIAQAPSPFLFMAFTMSSHEPFEVPMNTVISGDDIDSKMRNSIYYTDKHLGIFFDRCKASGIWDNTLFVLLADHGSRQIGNLPAYDSEGYRIPLLFTGGVVQVRDTVVSIIGSQTDMIATLFAQLGMDYSAYKYSKNLLDPCVTPFAFYSYPNAAGIVDEKGSYILDLKSNKNIGDNKDKESGRLLDAYLRLIDHDLKSDD